MQITLKPTQVLNLLDFDSWMAYIGRFCSSRLNQSFARVHGRKSDFYIKNNDGYHGEHG